MDELDNRIPLDETYIVHVIIGKEGLKSGYIKDIKRVEDLTEEDKKHAYVKFMNSQSSIAILTDKLSEAGMYEYRNAALTCMNNIIDTSDRCVTYRDPEGAKTPLNAIAVVKIKPFEIEQMEDLYNSLPEAFVVEILLKDGNTAYFANDRYFCNNTISDGANEYAVTYDLFKAELYKTITEAYQIADLALKDTKVKRAEARQVSLI